ncbi:sulfate permease family domain-containing protein [Ditylenchus destructor]|uniref:Sulfate permease family domain-containing protein n=1 Tax=Ditylenchus destructor TaxID=166010 RepID=A0AAD4MX16_9BILA|nr:sulfate permease family domain-containing protein [Ditylenchus destructor]
MNNTKSVETRVLINGEVDKSHDPISERIYSSDCCEKNGRTSYLNQEQFDEIFQYKPAPPFRFHLRRHCRCFLSPQNCFNFILSFFPVLQWLPDYSWKNNIVGDFVAGITVGIIHVPQGIAYAILTGVPPVYGLYTSFFGVLFYMVFGTSRHVSIGSFAIISLMTGPLSSNFIIPERDFSNITALTSAINQYEYIDLVQALTFTAGLIQILMAVLRVEFLASYLSDQLVNGFCAGAAVHVVVVQFNKLLQVSSGSRAQNGPAYLIRHIQQFLSNLSQTNPLALTVSLVSFIFLYIGKDLFNPRIRKCLPAPIPFELVLVVLATAISSVVRFEDFYGVNVVKTVPLGLPVARPPRLDLLPYVFSDALEIAFVVVALHLSMCKVFNRKMGTKTDNNQELYAMGLMGSLSSFFGTYPISSSIGRSMLNVESGAKTQLSAFFTALLLLVVILFFGPLLSALPMCVLAVIIIYSLKNIFQKMPYELIHLWHVSKIDFLIWVVTFCATVILNVMQGLAVSVAFALLTTVFRIQWPRWHLLSRLNGTEDYRDSGRYSHVTDVESVRIFRFDAPLLFTNAEHFANSARRAVTMPNKCLDSINDNDDLTSHEASSHQNTISNISDGANNESLLSPLDAEAARKKLSQNFGGRLAAVVEHLVVDCSGFTFVDYTSVNALIDLFHQLRQNHVNVYFAGAKAPVRDTLEKCGFYKSVGKQHFYPTIHDAVLAAIDKKRLYVRKRGISHPMGYDANNYNCNSKSVKHIVNNFENAGDDEEQVRHIDVMTSTTDIPRPSAAKINWSMGSINRVGSVRLDELDDV